MNPKPVLLYLVIIGGLALTGCGTLPIPTSISIPTGLPPITVVVPTGLPPITVPTFSMPTPNPGGEGETPTPGAGIPLTGDSPINSALLFYGLIALLTVIVLFTFLARQYSRPPDEPYRRQGGPPDEPDI